MNRLEKRQKFGILGPKKNQLPHFGHKEDFPPKMDSVTFVSAGTYLHVKNRKNMSHSRKTVLHMEADIRKTDTRKDRGKFKEFSSRARGPIYHSINFQKFKNTLYQET